MACFVVMTGTHDHGFRYGDLSWVTSGIISSVITFSHFENFVNDPSSYDNLSGAVVSTFTGKQTMSEIRPHFRVASGHRRLLLRLYASGLVE